MKSRDLVRGVTINAAIADLMNGHTKISDSEYERLDGSILNLNGDGTIDPHSMVYDE